VFRQSVYLIVVQYLRIVCCVGGSDACWDCWDDVDSDGSGGDDGGDDGGGSGGDDDGGGGGGGSDDDGGGGGSGGDDGSGGGGDDSGGGGAALAISRGREVAIHFDDRGGSVK